MKMSSGNSLRVVHVVDGNPELTRLKMFSDRTIISSHYFSANPLCDSATYDLQGREAVLLRSSMHYRGGGHLIHFNLQQIQLSFVVPMNHVGLELIVSPCKSFMQ